MQSIKMPFRHIDAGKPSVCFTWDDNFFAHQGLIAPQFSKRGMRCTFYINPGEPGFEKYASGYNALSENLFEIGSHGFFHHDFSKLPVNELEYELKQSALSVEGHTGVYPATFAFPYHAFNEETLNIARKFFLETRNTLHNSKRFGVRTDSTPDEMLLSVRECILNKQSLVFSGHSAIPAAPGFKEDTGHEPVFLHNLSALLDSLQTLRGSVEVLTFEQAALKQYIMNNCEISGNSYTLSGEQLRWLNTFRIDSEKLSRLI